MFFIFHTRVLSVTNNFVNRAVFSWLDFRAFEIVSSFLTMLFITSIGFPHSPIKFKWQSFPGTMSCKIWVSLATLASHADVLGDSSRIPTLHGVRNAWRTPKNVCVERYRDASITINIRSVIFSEVVFDRNVDSSLLFLLMSVSVMFSEDKDGMFTAWLAESLAYAYTFMRTGLYNKDSHFDKPWVLNMFEYVLFQVG